MNFRLFVVTLGSLGLGALLMGSTVARTQEEAPPPVETAPAPDTTNPPNPATDQEGVEVMARGPIHEAFAEPVIRSPRASPIVPKQPPDPIEELPPDQKPADENAAWIPGYWAWQPEQKDFIWVSGIWRVPPPDRQWVPGTWNQVANGWQWVPGFWRGQEQSEVAYLPEPPDPIQEAAPPAPDNSSVYIPGCWIWSQTRYLWRPGYWVAYRSGWLWMPDGYVWTPAGYVFVEGYWDYPFRDRGLLFAPAVINRRFRGRRGWTYRPQYVVRDDFLLGALFVYLAADSYYFGDYFQPRYAAAGFTPWVDFRVSGRYYDPIFDYYRYTYRNNPRWQRDLAALYVARREGRAPRPPLTLAQQTTVIRNSTRRTDIHNVTVLASLSQVKSVRLQRINATQLKEIRSHATEMRRVSSERRQMEAKYAGQPSARTRNEARIAKFSLPKVPRATARPTGAHAPPPLPNRPRPTSRTPTYAKEPTNHPGSRPGTEPRPKEEPRPNHERPPQERPRPELRPNHERSPQERPRPQPPVHEERKPPNPPDARHAAPEPKPAPRPAPERRPAPPPERPTAHHEPPAPHHEAKPPSNNKNDKHNDKDKKDKKEK